MQRRTFLKGLALLPVLAKGRGMQQVDRVYPWHTNITATVFWVGEIFDPNAPDGSQMLSAYDDEWFSHYGGYDANTDGGPRRVAPDYWPVTCEPKENPYYLDLPYDDMAHLGTRALHIPWANDRVYTKQESMMKNRWVHLRRLTYECYAQIEDAGPGRYNDYAYVFGSDDRRPQNKRYGGAGMDVSPAVRDILHFKELDGIQHGISWRFVEDVDVPDGPWKKIVTTSQVFWE